MRAWLSLRHSVPERARAFHSGLAKHGYTVMSGVTMKPGPKDALISWNRLHDVQAAATLFEERGLPVLICENSTWGNGFAGGHWYTIAKNFHNMAGRFPVDGPERWANLGIELQPWRTEGETVILPQRGIGPPGVAMPRGWGEHAQARYGGRIRPHPGQGAAIPLEDDLANAGRVITWGSGAAVKALIMGIPVVSEMPNFIGQQDNTDAGRVRMFEQLAWAQWQLKEIENGEAFDRLLGNS